MDAAHTFLVTDVEGSSRLWDAFPEGMMAALRIHDEILRAAVEAHQGLIFKTAGDSFFARFLDAHDAIGAACAAHLGLSQAAWPEPGPLLVRMAVTTGQADERDGDFFGPPLNRAARMLAAGHGGQILLDAASRDARLPEGVTTRDLGLVRLRGIDRPEPLVQLDVAGSTTSFPPLRTGEQGPATNLPTTPVVLHGRESELQTLVEIARDRDARLITLTGPGGSGKTALAIAAAVRIAPEVGGAYLVDLAPVSDSTRIVPTIAGVLGLREGAGLDLFGALVSYLSATTIILVLDNLEQIPGAGGVVAQIVASCPRTVIIATSRQPLRVRGEREIAVEPLDLDGAIQLFLERAKIANPRFAADGSQTRVLATICERLDRLPLAIELASARTRVLSLDQLSARLDRRLPLLTGGARDLPERQRTMAATIAWSYDLLDERERSVLRALSVFASGWDLGLAEQLLSPTMDSLDVLESITALTEQSLVAVEQSDDRPTFRLLATIREFARERAAEAGESETFADEHAELFARMVAESEPGLRGSDQSAQLAKLASHSGDLSLALNRLLSRPNADAGLRLTLSLVPFWRMRGVLSEARAWLGRAIAVAATGDEQMIARLCDESGIFAQDMGNLEEAKGLHRRALTIWTSSGDQRGVAEAESNLATIALFEGDEDEAERLFASSVARFRSLGERRGAAAGLNGLGMVAFWRGDPATARQFYEASLADWRDLGDLHSSAIALGNIGHALLTEHQLDAAEVVSREALGLFESLGDPGGIATSTLNIAFVALARGETARAEAMFRAAAIAGEEVGDVQTSIEASIGLGLAALAMGETQRAVTLLASAESRRSAHGISLSEALAEELARGIDGARAALDSETFTQAWKMGERLESVGVG